MYCRDGRRAALSREKRWPSPRRSRPADAGRRQVFSVPLALHYVMTMAES